MAFNTFLQCLVFGVLIMAVSQVGGTQTEQCNKDCVVKHIPSVTNVANVNGDGIATCRGLSRCRECLQDCRNAGYAAAAAKAGAGGVAVTSFTFLLSLAIGLFAM
jgi:hypothetical protein